MLKTSLLISAALAIGGLAASAESKPAPNALLTAGELRAEFPGTLMTGVHVGSGLPYTECMEPGGRSVFTFAGRTAEGTYTLSDDAMACFDYGDGLSCFRVQRAGKGYLVRSSKTSDVYRVKSVTRGVKACEGGDLVS